MTSSHLKIFYMASCLFDNLREFLKFYLLQEKRKLPFWTFFFSHPKWIVSIKRQWNQDLNYQRDFCFPSCGQLLSNLRLTHNFNDLLSLFILAVLSQMTSWIHGLLDKGKFISDSRHEPFFMRIAFVNYGTLVHWIQISTTTSQSTVKGFDSNKGVLKISRSRIDKQKYSD